MNKLDSHQLTMKHTFALLLLASSCSASAQWLTDNLIAHFPMNGSPNDTVAGLVPEVTSGAPGFCADRHGATNGAACFDGSSFWSYGDTLDMDTADFSIAYWVRLDTVLPPFNVNGINGQYLSDASLLVGKGTTVYGYPQRAGYSVMARNTNGVYSLSALWGGQNNDLIYDETPIILHDWFHVVQSRCGSQQTLHVNGQLIFDISTSANRDLSVDIVFALGAFDRDPTAHPDQGWLHGALDDVRIYKGRCLSQDELDFLADLTVGLNHRAPTWVELELYPNPAQIGLHIDLYDSSGITGPVTVLNTLGQPIPLSMVTGGLPVNGEQSLTLDVSHLPKGAYFVVIPTEQGSVHGKFVKD